MGTYAAVRHMDLLATPVVSGNDVPLFAFSVSRDWQWPAPTATESAGDVTVYLAPTDGLIKVGFSESPDRRVLLLNLSPHVFIVGVTMQHEKALHTLFADELRRDREYFAGPKIETFISGALMRSRSVARQYPRIFAHSVSRERAWRRFIQRNLPMSERAA
jgi:hypothetical protein